MNTFIVNERPLNDDVVYVADENKVFKGGYVAILEYYTFANEWSDHDHRKSFRSMESMQKFIAKRYPEFNDEIYRG